MKFTVRKLFHVLPMAFVILSGCGDFPAHIGMALLNFEIWQNGQAIHSFQADIRDDATLSQKWNLVLQGDIPAALATTDEQGEPALSGPVEIRMIHAGNLLSKASLAKVLLEPGSAPGTWRVKKIELERIKSQLRLESHESLCEE